MTQTEVLKLALDALELAQDNLRDHGDNCFLHDEGEYSRCFCGKDSLSDHLQSVVEKLDEALSKPSNPGELEPVAWTTGLYGGYCVIRAANPAAILPLNMALYTHPPQRKPLTDEEVLDMADGCTAQFHDLLSLARAIEAAHGIKENT